MTANEPEFKALITASLAGDASAHRALASRESQLGSRSVTISHEAIEGISLPAPIMTVGAVDPSIPSGLSAGERVDLPMENGKIVSFLTSRLTSPTPILVPTHCAESIGT